MVMNRLEAARNLPENSGSKEQFAIDTAELILKNAGVKDPGMPVVTSVEKQALNIETVKIYPEISLKEERVRQIQEYIKLGFHTKLGKTEAEYAKRFPEFTPQPKSFKGRFNTPVLVEIEISPKAQCALAGIEYALDGVKKTDWNKGLENYTTPEAPYATWLEDGRNNLNEKPENVRKNLKGDEIAGTELDGIALYISNPKILKHHYLDLPGTSVESDLAPSLRLWRGRPGLYVYFVSFAGPGFGSVVRGKRK